jgi:large subunit ribosomal protein L4
VDVNIIALISCNYEKIHLADAIFSRKYNQSLVHQVVTSYIAVSHQGSKSQKSRSDVSGSGVKPWKQKGTGKARAGTRRSPIFRKGGVTFASKSMSCRKKINKKMYHNTICIILSELLRTKCLLIIDKFDINSIKTKSLINKLQSLNANKALLVVGYAEYTKNIYLASRNIKNFHVCLADDINPINLIGFNKVLITSAAVNAIEEKML